MEKYPFMWVDAFTDQPLGGNPCAILFDTDGMSDAKMLAIAKEMHLSETSFVYKSPNADFGARYFTPIGEIPLAGHPTIATVFALIDSGRLSLTPPRQEVTLELKAGIIKIEIYSEVGQVKNIVMSQKRPQFLSTFRPEEILPIFGLTQKDALESFIIGISGIVLAAGSAGIRPAAVVSENHTTAQFSVGTPALTAFPSCRGRGLRK